MLLKDRASFPANSRNRESLDHLMRAARDSAHMIGRLREIYRPRSENTELSAVDVNDLVVQVVALTTPKWQAQAEAGGATIMIEHDCADVPLIAGTPEELREVMTNLIFNAVDAMPRGGTIRLRTRQVDGCVRIEVSDTGSGMTEATRRHCLEPFYTTKGEKGTGLGLAVSAGIIRRHGGKVAVESQLNRGTTFRIDLPVPDGDFAIPRNPPEKPREGLRVLLVDDQKGICDVVSSYLSEDRHHVEIAQSSSEAMKKYRHGYFDLVITDRAMPGVNGDELATAIKRLNPEQRIIMLTGFADLMRVLREKNDDVDLLLGKPVCLEDLRQAINEVMSVVLV
jgi:CheY-like chemotaxis protein